MAKSSCSTSQSTSGNLLGSSTSCGDQSSDTSKQPVVSLCFCAVCVCIVCMFLSILCVISVMRTLPSKKVHSSQALYSEGSVSHINGVWLSFLISL